MIHEPRASRQAAAAFANLKTLKGAALTRHTSSELAYHEQVLNAVDKTLIRERADDE